MAFVGLIVILILIYFYLFPTILAYHRKHTNATSICVLNVFLGWTLIGWVAALIWACSNQKNKSDGKQPY